MRTQQLCKNLLLILLVLALGTPPLESMAKPSEMGGVAAVVNGREISQANLESAVRALAADSNHTIGQAERRRVLDRLIEEELLVQRAVELDLEVKDRNIRNRLVGTMI